jgi:glycosyltransferase involved in cell wall biosynthesis
LLEKMGATFDSRPRLLLIVEPIASPDAVQFKFVYALGSALLRWFRVTIASTYLEARASVAFRAQGLAVLDSESGLYLGRRTMNGFGFSSESMLWSEAWLREAALSSNQRLLRRLLRDENYEYVVNATNTCVWECDVWWIQGPPLVTTLDSMWSNEGNRVGPVRLIRPLIRLLDNRLTRRLQRAGTVAIPVSRYVGDVYRKLGFPIADTIYSLTDHSEFRPQARVNRAPYVVTYIGKETEVDTVLDLVGRGLNVVGFGSKLLPRIARSIEGSGLDFRGRVTQEELVRLYSDAEFTAFPFTNEPLGQVPIESMACGTPVLTYAREGPSETVINGETGWLVRDRAEFVRTALRLWKGFDRAPFRQRALERASQLTPREQARRLSDVLLARSAGTVTPGPPFA